MDCLQREPGLLRVDCATQFRLAPTGGVPARTGHRKIVGGPHIFKADFSMARRVVIGAFDLTLREVVGPIFGGRQAHWVPAEASPSRTLPAPTHVPGTCDQAADWPVGGRAKPRKALITCPSDQRQATPSLARHAPNAHPPARMCRADPDGLARRTKLNGVQYGFTPIPRKPHGCGM